MPDPVTLGTYVVEAFTFGAGALAAGAIGEAGVNAYNELKSKVAAWVGKDVEVLEQAHDSLEKQALVAAAIDRQPVDRQEEARHLAQRLLDALERQAAEQPIGLDIGRLGDVQTKLGNIIVHQGTGVRLQEATGGSFTTGDISVGQAPGKLAK